MDTVFIGSCAIHFWCKEFREPKDIDLWSYLDLEILPEIDTDTRIDYHKIPKEIFDLIPSYSGYATMNAVYTIKCSHLGWDNFMWDKHKQDVLWMKSKGCHIISDLYKALTKHWKKEFGNKEFLSLAQDKEGFFTDHVNYIYDHDDIHEVIAYPNMPMYLSCLKEGEKVLLDVAKFHKLSYDEKIRLFTEEIIAISCERWLCNPYWMERGMTINKSHTLAVKKTITNLTKNWATDFIVHNLAQFSKPDYFLYKKVIKKLNLQEKIMSKVDTTELKAFHEAYGKEWGNSDDFSSFIFDCCDGLYGTNKVEGFTYKHLDQDGGGEGGAEDCYGVFQVNDTIYKAEYYYQSYNGHEYDGIEDTLRVVTPRDKTITVYE